MQNSHQAIEHFTAHLHVDVSILVVIHTIRLSASTTSGENFLYELLDLLLIVHPVSVVDVAAFALLE